MTKLEHENKGVISVRFTSKFRVVVAKDMCNFATENQDNQLVTRPGENVRIAPLIKCLAMWFGQKVMFS